MNDAWQDINPRFSDIMASIVVWSWNIGPHALPGFSPCITSPAHYFFPSGDTRVWWLYHWLLVFVLKKQYEANQPIRVGQNVNKHGVACSVCSRFAYWSALMYNIAIIQQSPLKNTCQLYHIYTNIVARKLECFSDRFRFCVSGLLMKMLAKPLA